MFRRNVLLLVGLIGLVIDPEEGGNTFFRNIGKLLSDYTSHPRTWRSLRFSSVRTSYRIISEGNHEM
jgi:hypothetical protein